MTRPVRIVAVLEDIEPRALVEIDDKTFLVSDGAIDRSREISESHRRSLIAKHGWTPLELEAESVERAIELVGKYAIDPASLVGRRP